MKIRKRSLEIWWFDWEVDWQRLARWLLPTPGNVLFTLLVVAGLLWASNAGALPLRAPVLAGDSTTTISYQGRLADSNGDPVTTSGVGMQFRLYNTDTGGSSLWDETHAAVPVEDGLFHVLLGSTNPIPVSLLANNSTLWLGITVGSDSEMSPREQIASVPYAMIASTVPNGSITTAKIADGAVTTAKLNVDNGLAVNGYLDVNDGNIAVGSTSNMGGNNYGRISFRYASGNIHLRSATSGVTGGHALAIDLQNDDSSLLEIVRQAVGPVAYIKANGDFSASGTKSAMLDTAHYGQRKLYAAESPEVRFFDEGLARLHNGVARVNLDPVFLETIEGEYLVHVTPYGDASLYVAEIGKDHFVVKARDGDPNVAFVWRLSAHRKGYAGVRLEKVTLSN